MAMWRPSPRTDTALAAIAAADQDRRSHPDRYDLDPDRITAVAARNEGDVEAFTPGWREALEQYLGSADQDGRLNSLGIGMVARTAVGRLRAGSAMTRHLAARPEIETRSLLPPIIITGGWRTGTTFLFRLLATDPRLRAPLPAELTAPCRIADLDGPQRESFMDRSAVAHDMLHALNPEMRSIHDSGARLPEECVLGMGTDLRNWAFTSTTRLDSYAAWLADQDLTSTYREYRRLLQVLDRGDGRRWVLKAPPHIAELPAVVAAFPGATIVWLRRDITETIASGASLFAVFRSTYSDEVDPVDVGRFQADQTELWFRRAMSFRGGPGSATATFVDVDYADLVGDTEAAVATVYAASGLEPPDDPSGLIDAYNRANPRHVHGRHRYEPHDFGLDPDALGRQFAFLDD